MSKTTQESSPKDLVRPKLRCSMLIDMADMGKASGTDGRLKVERGKVNGKPRFLWSAVDEAGEVLDIYATETHDEAAALQILEKSLKTYENRKIRSATSIPRRK